MRIISRFSTVVEFDCTLICEAISRALGALEVHNEFLERLNKLLSGELTEEQYQELINERLASLYQSQNEPFYSLDYRENMRCKRKHDPVQQSILSFLQKRKRRQGPRISQGDLNSTPMDESMPIPPTFKKGGMHYTAEVGV